MRNRLFIVLALAAGFSVPLFAHHGGASIYNDRIATMKATVKTWLWSNPHCLLTFEVKGEDGKVVEWIAETQAPNSIYPLGYRKDTFKPGDAITITVRPVKNGQPVGSLAKVVLADGTTTLGAIGGGAVTQ